MFHRISKVAGAAMALALIGCGTIKTKDRNVSETQSIKRAALIAFTADLPARSGIGLNMNSGKAEGSRGGSMLNQNSPETERMMRQVSQAFGSRMKWAMLDPEKATEAPAYREAYKKTMEGWQNKMPPASGTNRFVVRNMMDSECLRILDQPNREKLMQDLKVDALIVSKVDVVLSGTTVMGVGSRYPQSKMFFQVFKKGHERPVWWETLDGKVMEESVGKTGLTLDEKKIADLGLRSLQDGLAKLN